MPKVVVRKGYRCQPGKRREVLTALQRIDAAAAEVGYPRGRYLLVETRAPGEPDLEVEFTFESYAEMEQLERRMREHVARYMRDGGSTGQEFLIEPSATRHLLSLDDGVATTSTAPAAASTTQQSRRPTGTSSPAQSTPPTRAGAPGPAGAAGTAAVPASRAAQPQGQRSIARTDEPPAWMDDDEEDFDESDLPEPDVPPPPEIPPEMSTDQFRSRQIAAARAALANAERTVNLQPRGGQGGSRNRPADQGTDERG